jgi:AcrR family transcriptional regulator
MAVETSLRERKKARTRRELSDTAVALFSSKGFDATTVEEICERAEVSPSTFFRYFASKEAAAFPDEEERAGIVEAVLGGRADDESWAAIVRRAAHALCDHDLDVKKDFKNRVELMSREPALAAWMLKTQAEAQDRYATILAHHAGLDAQTDMRPRLIVSSAFAAANTAWAVWMARDSAGDLHALIDEAFDIVDAGTANAL